MLLYVRINVELRPEAHVCYFYCHQVPIWFIFVVVPFFFFKPRRFFSWNKIQLKLVDNYFIWIQNTQSKAVCWLLIDLYFVLTNELLTSKLHHVWRAHDFINLDFLNSWKSIFFSLVCSFFLHFTRQRKKKDIILPLMFFFSRLLNTSFK